MLQMGPVHLRLGAKLIQHKLLEAKVTKTAAAIRFERDLAIAHHESVGDERLGVEDRQIVYRFLDALIDDCGDSCVVGNVTQFSHTMRQQSLERVAAPGKRRPNETGKSRDRGIAAYAHLVDVTNAAILAALAVLCDIGQTAR